MTQKELPKLMVDSSEKDGKAEIIMDYVLSWCLRRADEICQRDNKPILYEYCRYMLGKLCEIDVNDSVNFKNVEVWKEDQNIDLWVELEVEINDTSQKHAILIENKYYTGLHLTRDSDGEYRNQLEVYKKRFDEHYSKKEEEWKLHYNLVTCVERESPAFTMYDIAKDFGYQVHSFYDMLISPEPEPTESDIFNEFWIRW
jgi:hypothetical protein